MKRDAYKRMDYARFVDDNPDNFNEVVEVIDAEKRVSPTDAILQEIYAPDPRTGLPTGDIGYFVSDKANPEIKQFILEQLFMDVSASANPTAPKGLSDDDILLLSRQTGESNQDYMNRLNGEIDNFKRINDELSKRSVSKDSVQQSPVE